MAKIDENSIVEKSRFLLGMQAPSYELGELKVLDTYLARINARDPETKLVKFTKSEYEQLMGVTQIKTPQLKKYTQALLGKVVTVPYGKNGYDQYTLFTHARCDQDPDTLEWTVELGCNEKLEPLFFNIQQAGYLRYRLRNVLPLTSKYSMLLYLYLKDNIFRATFEVNLKELRSIIDALQKSYESFKEFRRRVLDPAIEEINEKTDITASYERKVRGRLTVGLTFTVAGKKATNLIEEDDMEQIGMFDDELAASIETSDEDDDDIDFWRDALKESSFLTNEQIEEIHLALIQCPYASVLAYDRHLHGVERDLALHGYLMAQDRYTRSHKPKNYYSYLLQAIRDDYAGVG